jgi:hypothetical protein
MMTRLREMVARSEGGHLPEKRMKPGNEIIIANNRLKATCL